MPIVTTAISAMTAKDVTSALKENELGNARSLTAVIAKLIGFTLETSCIQVGMALAGTRAVLMKSSGKVRNAPIPKTVSALLVLRPSVSEIPDHANPKKAMMNRVSRIPAIPVAMLKPNSIRQSEDDCRLDGDPEGVGREPPDEYRGAAHLSHEHLLRNPEFRSSTIDVPDCSALLKAFCIRIPGVANSRYVIPEGKRPGTWANLENSWVKRTRKIMGWKREKKMRIGLRSELLQRPDEEILRCRRRGP